MIIPSIKRETTIQSFETSRVKDKKTHLQQDLSNKYFTVEIFFMLIIYWFMLFIMNMLFIYELILFIYELMLIYKPILFIMNNITHL